MGRRPAVPRPGAGGWCCAQAVADELACATGTVPGADRQPALVEHGLRLALELRDPVITYRSRYPAPAPALDLMLADLGNLRGLAFNSPPPGRCCTRSRATRMARWPAALRPCCVRSRCHGAGRSGRAGARSAATRLPPGLADLRDEVAGLSNRVSRRYFPHCSPRRAASGSTARRRRGWVPRDLHQGEPRHQLRLRDPGRPQRPPGAFVAARPAVSAACCPPSCTPSRRHPGGADGTDHFGNAVTWLFLDVAHPAFEVDRRGGGGRLLPDPPPPRRNAGVGVLCGRHGAPRRSHRMAGGGIFVRQSAGAGQRRSWCSCAAPSPSRPADPARIARPERADQPGFRFPAGVATTATTIREVLNSRQGVSPGFFRLDDQRIARAWVCRHAMFPAISASRLPPGGIGAARAPTSLMRVGCWLGPGAWPGSIWTRPTIWW